MLPVSPYPNAFHFPNRQVSASQFVASTLWNGKVMMGRSVPNPRPWILFGHTAEKHLAVQSSFALAFMPTAPPRAILGYFLAISIRASFGSPVWYVGIAGTPW